jgi:hypothetical protein
MLSKPPVLSVAMCLSRIFSSVNEFGDIHATAWRNKEEGKKWLKK